MKKMAIILYGPTASGKTELAFDIAQNIPSVLINADSRQIYKSLDIIVGKDIPLNTPFVTDQTDNINFTIGHYQLQNTKIYLLDIVDLLNIDFSVYDYINCVKKTLLEISEPNIPIFVGGSNFYISALINSPETAEIPPNYLLREKLSSESCVALRRILGSIDSSRLAQMNNSDKNNPRRLIRAIEVAEWKKEHTIQKYESVLSEYDICQIALTAPLDLLRKKIDARVDARVSEGGVDEAKKLFSTYEHISESLKKTNGYYELFEYFKGNISYTEAIQKWKFAEYHNAKKQLTWIHGDSNIKKFSITDEYYSEKILQEIFDFLERE